MSSGDGVVPPGDLWYPLLALVEHQAQSSSEEHPESPGIPMRGQPGTVATPDPPSPELREAILRLREALRKETGACRKQFWLLLDTGSNEAPNEPSALEVGRVLEELRQRFQELREIPSGQGPDFEAFLREKMRELGFEDLGSAPLLPDLQREALRGLGVGLGSQLAQLLGKMAGWHGESRSARPREVEEARAAAMPKLLRLELGPALAADKSSTALLRQEVGRCRRRHSARLGWELSGLQLAAGKELEADAWRLSLRGQQVAEGRGIGSFAEALDALLESCSSDLLTFADFENLLRHPGCKAATRELRALGLEKAALWAVCRRMLLLGGHLRDPLTVLERLLEAALTSRDREHLAQAALG